MKQIRLMKILAVGLASAASVGIELAQTTTTTDPATDTTTIQQTTTRTAGNIVTYTPNSNYFMFRTASGAPPVRYYYTKDGPRGHAGHCLLFNSGRLGRGAQSSVSLTCGSDKARGNDYDDYHETVSK